MKSECGLDTQVNGYPFGVTVQVGARIEWLRSLSPRGREPDGISQLEPNSPE